MENRAFQRANISMAVTVDYRFGEMTGTIENVSLYGLYIAAAESLPIGSKVALRVHVSGEGSALTIEMAGEIVRVDPRGFGIRIDTLGLDAFLHWRHLVACAAGSPEKIEQEFQHFLQHQMEVTHASEV